MAHSVSVGSVESAGNLYLIQIAEVLRCKIRIGRTIERSNTADGAFYVRVHACITVGCDKLGLVGDWAVAENLACVTPVTRTLAGAAHAKDALVWEEMEGCDGVCNVCRTCST